MNKRKFDIIYKHFAIPVSNLKESYESSALTVDNNVVSSKVVQKFEELMTALKEQLNKYRG